MNDFGFYFQLGWQHIISWEALDHILFVLALSAIYLLTDWRQVLVLVTAFTIGHSLTLALSTLQLITVPSAWVEFLIPCTIVFTACSNLFIKTFSTKAIRFNYFLALFFGLVHGLGFANTLRFLLAQDQSFGWALFGFNLGLEAGQIVIVFFILLASLLVVQFLKMSRRHWVVFLSTAVFGIALKMAIDRFPHNS